MSVSSPEGSGLGLLLKAGGPALRAGLHAVEVRLESVLDGWHPPAADPASGTIAAGGKRLRPLLVLVSGGLPEQASVELIRAAVAVELIHAATLVHDDVLDAADMRRGRPTVVAASGRGLATAAGDLLFSRAFAELAANGSIEQLRALSQASSALARGELLQREDAWDPEVSLERYLMRCECKTASLFQAACRLGVLAGAGKADAQALGAFGRRIGLAFQLLDDVLDVSGPPARTGKPRGADLLDGTVTLPLILSRARDPQLAQLDPRTVDDPDQAASVCERIEATGALGQVRDMAERMVAEAKDSLDAGVEPRRRRMLELAADGVVARYA